MLLQLRSLVKSAAIVLAALVLFTQNVDANDANDKMQPIWEKINGEWKFNNLDKQKHHNLVYVVTTTKNKPLKSIITKEMVKLPFIQILDQGKKEEITLH